MQNLTPEELEYLRQYVYQQGQYGLRPENVNVTGADGQTYHPTYTGGMDSEGTSDTTTLTGFMKDVNPGQNQVGDMQQMYGTGGQYQGTAAIPKDTSTADLLKFAAAAAAMGYGGSMFGGGSPSFGYELGGGLGNSAASAGGGGGLLSGIGDSISGGMKSIGNGISGMFGGGAAGGAGSATSFGVLGDPATATVMKNYGAAGLAKYALPALGAILGSQGQKTSQTTSRQTDPRLDPYYFDEGGLLPTARGLLQQQFSPTGMQAINNIGQAGQGLLQRPISTGKLIGRF